MEQNLDDKSTDLGGSDELPERRLKPSLPEARPSVRRKLVEALLDKNFNEAAAEAVARSVEDPKALMEQLKAPAELGVHGGTIYYVLTRVKNATVLPIPTNPRVAGEVHYASGGGSSAGAIEALSVTGFDDGRAGLTISSSSRQSLRQDMQAAADFVRSNNPLKESVSTQGVLLPATLVPVCFTFNDGVASQTILCTVDGSSRLTAAMDVWDLSPDEVLFELTDGLKFRGRVDPVTQLLNADAQSLTDTDRAMLRTRVLPAQLIVGWEPEEPDLTFPDILDAYLGLLHVEPPTPWGEAAGQDTRAEAVLDELVRAGKIGTERRQYLAGHMTPAEASELGVDASLDGRSAALFFELDRRHNANAVNKALRRIGMKRPRRVERLEVATELAMRPYRRSVPDLNRRNPRQALPAAMESLRPDESDWVPTITEPQVLLSEAIDDLVSGSSKKSQAELAVRGAFWLTRYSCLQKSSRTDPRQANEVLREVQQKEHGLRCLYQAIIDGRSGIVPRIVREDGSIMTTGAGVEAPQTDRWLRETFPRSEEENSDETSEDDQEPSELLPSDVLRERIYSLRDEASTLRRRVDSLKEVKENDQSLVDRIGIASGIVEEISTDLDSARTRVLNLGSVWQRTSDTSAS